LKDYFTVDHLIRNKMVINKALLKYGYGNFRLEIMEYYSASLCLEREQYYLDLLKPEYNILKVAGSSTGYKHSLETIGKLKGREHSDETKAKMREKALTSKRLEQLKRLNASLVYQAKRLEHLKNLQVPPCPRTGLRVEGEQKER
jgi:group I intron endonuclease